MNFTPDFSTALRGICIASLLMLLPIALLQYLGMYGFSSDETTPINRLAANLTIYICYIGMFWAAIYHVSKDKKASLVGFAIALVGQLMIAVLLSTKGTGTSIGNIFFWSNLIFSVGALVAFGWLHFQNTRGLYLGLAAIITSGILYGMNSYEYYRIIENLLEMVGGRDVLSMQIPTGENSYRTINPILSLLYQFSHPMSFLVFWFAYNVIKRDEPFDISMRTVTMYEYIDKNTYALVHWVLRMVLVAVMIGSLSFMSRLMSQGFSWTSLMKLINFCVAIYVVGALYRNVLLAFYSTKKTYPSWLYVFLNIPYFHFIPWLYLFFLKNRKKPLVSVEDILDEVKPEIPLLLNAKKTQKEFVRDEKNSGIKVLIIIALIFGAVMQVLGYNNSMIGFPIANKILVGAFSMISLALSIWYMSDSKAMYPIFILQSIAILATLVFQNEMIMGVTAMAGLINLLIYYPLFHYDKMTFRREELEGE